jgi:hypothetical protein
LEKISWLQYFKSSFLVIKFGMCPEEIFDPPGRKGKNSKCFCLVELNIFNRERNGKFGIRCGDDCIEILEDFFNSDGEG